LDHHSAGTSPDESGDLQGIAYRRQRRRIRFVPASCERWAHRLAKCCAPARAAHWSVPLQECVARNGSIVHTPTNRSLTYGELAIAAARLPAVALGEARLKRAEDFHVIGQGIPRVDLHSKVSGSARFGIDVRVPSMLYAVVARCPYFGGRLKALMPRGARTVSGVRAVFQISPLPRRYNTAGGVAVVADSTWAALQGRKALTLEWEKGPGKREHCGAAWAGTCKPCRRQRHLLRSIEETRSAADRKSCDAASRVIRIAVSGARNHEPMIPPYMFGQ